MPVDVKLPQLGESTYEGTIGKWLKKPGEKVERFEPLVEIITDKVNVEMPAPYGGTLTEILVDEGATISVGTPIARMETADGAQPAEGPEQGRRTEAPAQRRETEPGTQDVPASKTVAAVEKERTAPAAAPAQPAKGDGPRLSPVVRKLAEEHGLPLDEVATLHGTGAGGRVTKEDVLKYLEGRKEAPAAVRPAPAPGPAVPAAPAAGVRPGDEVVKLTPLRRSVAQRMAQSKRDIPHAYGVVEVDMTALVRWRDAHKDAWRAREGVNVTYTAFFVRAVVEALKAYPIVNSTWADDGIILRKAVSVGIGIALDDGLIVAVIHDADQKSLVGIATDLDRLGRMARDGKLTLDEVQGGTFTITNPGVFGSIWSMPIIVPGQAAILATDAIVKRPVVRDDAIAIRDVMHLGLSFDHRIFDGAVADQFLNRIKARLEGFAGGDAALTDF
ncbi:MAG TPA: dihydrolipoamide acetyltransferase family protein [bacterium]|jgi:2-oxoisovalerate dehydrogenase E2 component (dihydrolipoyl transacylase)|nr:dihydrolipoamide acetyltransferase family protein [bacterium]